MPSIICEKNLPRSPCSSDSWLTLWRGRKPHHNHFSSTYCHIGPRHTQDWHSSTAQINLLYYIGELTYILHMGHFTTLLHRLAWHFLSSISSTIEKYFLNCRPPYLIVVELPLCVYQKYRDFIYPLLYYLTTVTLSTTAYSASHRTCMQLSYLLLPSGADYFPINPSDLGTGSTSLYKPPCSSPQWWVSASRGISHNLFVTDERDCHEWS